MKKIKEKNIFCKTGKTLIVSGLLLIVAAFFLTVWNLVEEHRAAILVKDAIAQLELTQEAKNRSLPEQQEPAMTIASEREIPDYQLNPEMEMPQQEVGDWEYIGILEIPSYDLNLPVISDWSYPAFKSAPCRYEGSVYQDDLIIAAHNYKSHFSCLKDLKPGTEIRFTDLDGNRFFYQVIEQEVLKPDDVEKMLSGEWDLTLFTCTIGGQYRVTVRCRKMMRADADPSFHGTQPAPYILYSFLRK